MIQSPSCLPKITIEAEAYIVQSAITFGMLKIEGSSPPPKN